MLKVSIGHSIDPDSESAIQEVIETCIQELDGTIPKAGILFAAPDYNHQLLLDKLNNAFPALELIGGTSNSELSSQQAFQQDSLVLTLFSSDTLEIRAGVGLNVQRDPQTAAQQSIQSATHQLTQPIQLCLALPDGLKANGSRVVDSLQIALPDKIPIIGGSTSEQFQYDVTYQFYKNQVLTDAVLVLVFAGELELAFGVNGGWRTIGSQGIVTKSENNIVYEIDHQPARDFYTKYFGNLTVEPAANGLAVFESNGDNFYVRALQQEYDAQATDLAFLGNVPQGTTVQLTEANRCDIIEGAKQSIQQALSNYNGMKPAVLLCFSCAGRRMWLGRETKREYDMIASQLHAPLPSVGFYSYGEIAPLGKGRNSRYHNYTLVSLILGTE